MAVRLYGQINLHNSQDLKTKYWNDNWQVYGYIDETDPKYSILEFVPKSYKFYAGQTEFNGEID